MDMMLYSGGWVETSSRNPDSLTVLAPQNLQEICLKHGGRHPLSDKPNFRLVLLSSRYQLAGGQSVTKLDDNGNKVRTTPAEVFLPRYHVPAILHGCYVLEMYRDCSELHREGYGKNDVEWDATKGVRTLEPAWTEGCYEAIWNGPQNPLTFKRDVVFASGAIRWAIWLVHRRLATRVSEIQQFKKDQLAKEKEQRIAENTELLRSKRRAFLGEPMVSLT